LSGRAELDYLSGESWTINRLFIRQNQHRDVAGEVLGLTWRTTDFDNA
jgi:hypothetical protein